MVQIIQLLRTSDDIQRMFIKRGYNINCYIDRYSREINQCHVYSLPFSMEYMCNVANNFVGGLFMSVRQLQLYDFLVPFEHDFFARISRAFPLLNILNVISLHGQKKKLTHQQNEHKQTSSIIEYPHLMYLSLNRVYVDYIKQFLFESNAYLPYLNKLSVQYQDLIDAIENFTNNAEKVNCAKLKYIILFSKPSMYPENFHDYFPSLVNKLLF
ncbi:unnamed protein product [Rotaria sordida]|uniref:Uncharacterized protein n=1 Tax=Rotaria sordida TaxID=392033 RepID=A0A819P7E5_9BILA|nr:unnamed protein product [Rotaria sordida]